MASHEQDPIEFLTPEQRQWMTYTAAEQTAELFAINRHPVVAAVCRIENEESESADDVHMGLVVQYVEQKALIEMFGDGVRGIGGVEQVGTYAKRFLGDENTLIESMLVADSMSKSISEYAASLNLTNRQLVSKILSGESERILDEITHDISKWYADGLVAEDGNVENLEGVADQLRLFNEVLLFKPQLQREGYAEQAYKLIYEQAVGEKFVDAGLHAQANRYALAYQDSKVNGAYIRRIRRQAMGDVAEVTNRAALLMLTFRAMAWTTEVQNIEETRRRHEIALRTIGRATDLPELHNRIMACLVSGARLHMAERSDAPSASSIEKALQVEWEVLPPGELEERAQTIIDSRLSSGTATEVMIDRKRMNILHNLRELWGKDRSFYAYCRLGKRQVVRKGGDEEPDQYVMVILQEHDEYGKVLREHAVAESPIAGPNAMYVFRQDVSEGLSWREVMALPKSDARYFNTRALRHRTPASGQGDLITTMTNKAYQLLTCQPEAFLRLQFAGDNSIRLPKAALPPIEETK